MPVRNSRGGFNQNPASALNPKKVSHFYQPEVDYPNLLRVDPKTNQYNSVAAFSGKMVNRPLKDGEKIFRFFGPARTTHGVAVDEALAGGAWWGLGSPPKSAKEWRELAAVLDIFNGDGYCVSARIVGNNGPKAVVGTVSEQFGEKIPGQYLPGGASQAFFYLDNAFKDILNDAGKNFMNGINPGRITDPSTGIEFTFHSTNWTDANGIWGYIQGASTTMVQTARVGSREQATKDNREVTIRP